jgi:hypothetical protein
MHGRMPDLKKSTFVASSDERLAIRGESNALDDVLVLKQS